MNLFEKVVAGSWQRRTRFHDEKGTLASPVVWLNIVPAFIEKIRLIFSIPSTLPIVNYQAIKIFKKLTAAKKITVLEFGSGRSTMWWAQRCEVIYSVEDNKVWVDVVSDFLKKNNINNCVYKYAETEQDYICIDQPRTFDLIIIDGSYRGASAEHSIKNYCHANTVIYLDDSDKCASFFAPNILNDVRHADACLTNFAFNNDYYVLRLRDFSPTHMFVKEGSFFIPKNEKFASMLSGYVK